MTLKDEQSREAPERVWIWEGDAEYHLDHSYGGCDSTEFVRADLPTSAGIDRAIEIVKAKAIGWSGEIDKQWNEELRPDLAFDLSEKVRATTEIIAALEAEKEKP